MDGGSSEELHQESSDEEDSSEAEDRGRSGREQAEPSKQNGAASAEEGLEGREAGHPSLGSTGRRANEEGEDEEDTGVKTVGSSSSTRAASKGPAVINQQVGALFCWYVKAACLDHGD